MEQLKKEAKILMELIRKSIKNGIRLGRDEKPYKIHVSSLYDFCIKRLDIAIRNKVPYSPVKSIDLGRAFTFKQGRYLQDLIVDGLLEEAPELVLSKFVCRKCKKEVIATGKEKVCKCGDLMERHEVTVEYKIPNTKFSIIGNVDLMLGFGTFYPFELKSTRPEDFNARKPIFKYTYQLGSYMWLIERSGIGHNISNEFGMLLYISKAHNSNPIKGFFIPKHKVEHVFRDNDKIVEDIKSYAKNKKIIKLCRHYKDPIGRDCPFRKICNEEEQK